MNNRSGLISIILPTYNRAHLLPMAIESVLLQTYEHWELIIWNDGSSDNTEEILNSYKDTRIQTFGENNRGMSYGLNQGLRLAKGNLIAFLDDDDTWLPEKLAIQTSIMEKHSQLDLVFGNFTNVNIENQSQDIGFDQTHDSLALLNTEFLDDSVSVITRGFLEGLSRDNFIAFDSVMIREKVVKTIGNFNENLKIGMDFEYWWRLGLAGLKVAFTDEIVMNRFKYPGSLSGRSLNSALNRLITLDTCKELAIAEGRSELVDLLNPQYRNTWQHLILFYGREGRKKEMINAFRESLKYGLRPGTVKLLVMGILNLGQNK